MRCRLSRLGVERLITNRKRINIDPQRLGTIHTKTKKHTYVTWDDCTSPQAYAPAFIEEVQTEEGMKQCSRNHHGASRSMR